MKLKSTIKIANYLKHAKMIKDYHNIKNELKRKEKENIIIKETRSELAVKYIFKYIK